MNDKEIEEIVGLPFFLVLELCKDPQLLKDILSLTYHQGVQEGQSQVSLTYNGLFRELFRGYNKISITN